MSPELPRVLRRALGLMRFAREAVGASATSMFLVGHDDRSLHGLISEWDWTRTSFSTRLDEWPSVAAALADGETRRLDVFEARAAETGWFEERGIVSSICVPMRAHGRPLGVLFFDFAEDVAVGRLGHAVLADVGRRCARALDRAALVVPPVHARWIH